MMKSKYWNYGILVLVVIGIFVLSGCTQSKEYVCPDGTTVSHPSLCSSTQEEWSSEPEQPKYSDCDKFLSKSEKASCKYDVAEAIGDMRYCITDYKEDYDTDISSNIDHCLDNVLLNNKGKITLSDCEYYQTYYHEENCKLTVIVERKEYALCGTLSDDYDIDRCYSDIARDLKDKNICEKIQDDERRYECIDDITKYSR